MALGVWIDALEEVKLVFLNLDYTIQVSGLEYTIKNELSLQLQWRVHALKSAIKKGGFVKTIYSQLLLHEVGFNYATTIHSVTFH